MSTVRVTRPYRKRRQYPSEFKAQLVTEAKDPEHQLLLLPWIMISTPAYSDAGLLSQSKQINSYRQLLYLLIFQQ